MRKSVKYMYYYLHEKDNTQQITDDCNFKGSVVDNVYVVEITETLHGFEEIELLVKMTKTSPMKDAVQTYFCSGYFEADDKAIIKLWKWLAGDQFGG